MSTLAREIETIHTSWPRRALRMLFEYIEDGFDKLFSSAWNPFYQLGALGWFCYWIVIVSGIYLYIFFDTGLSQAYQSVEAITNGQWYAGGVMRSLHRYASDLLVIVIVLHLLREFALDRYRGKRWFAWVTGVPLLWFVYGCGISGYWLVWDKLAQYIAIATTEWLDTLPFFGEPIARNFLNNTTLSGRFFTLMVFIHIAVPLITLFLMWIHIQRHTKPKVNPPRGLAMGMLAMLVVLSFAYPALSQGGADLDKVPAQMGLDWFYLPAYPLLDRIPGAWLWAAFATATLLLFLLPWLPPASRQTAAVVDLDNCNGCSRCAVDCPFSAITMGARTDNLPFQQQAVVNPDHCTSCGLCVGSCPTATPFRRNTELIPGIDLPQRPLLDLREQTIATANQLSEAEHIDGRIIAYACDHCGSAETFSVPGVAVLKVPCVGNLPPAFIDFVISHRHADGVLLSGCRSGDCHFRLGIHWTEQRIAGERDPHLRQRVPRERIATCWTGPSQLQQRYEQLNAFREHLKTLGPLPQKIRSVPVTTSVTTQAEGG